MPKVADALSFLESIAPSRWAFDFDNVGLLFGGRDQDVTGIAFALDASHGLINFAQSFGANLLITHHPIFFSGTKSVDCGSADGRLVLSLAQAGCNLIAAHTNWDCAPGGISDTMAELLELTPRASFGDGAEVPYSKIVTFVPVEYTDAILDVMADHGAGFIGNYRRCAFKSSGIGTFEPMEGSDPFIGRVGKSEEVEEDRLEMICPSRLVDDVVEALVEKHPYEQPAFDVIPLRPLVEQPLGRIGTLDAPTKLSDFRLKCEKAFGGPALAWGDPGKPIERVAVVGGAGDHSWHDALRDGADAFVTGEVKHHIAKEASDAGLAILSCGHFATENPGMGSLMEMFDEHFPHLRCKLYTPNAGESARPI
ncbi:MAG: Nif3-like dinuclear metal center hexameric protein [Armatimonadetes bacterium]|nr:Nif3-like dinuclear metal center hexameric protein [Armatimonadota bacterium]